jgi:hypothetical protein
LSLKTPLTQQNSNSGKKEKKNDVPTVDWCNKNSELNGQ